MNEITSKLLSPQEKVACDQIAFGQTPHSLRAQALLALDDGSTQAQAAARSGLTVNQVKYWSGRFRILRLGIFPLDMQQPSTPEPDQEAVSESEEVSATEIPAAPPEIKPGKKVKKGKKAKKSKKRKKDKSKGKKKKSKQK
jgi:hypothetical protein